MKIFIIALQTAALLTAFSSAHAEIQSAEKAEILSVAKKFIDSFERLDSESAILLLTEDATLEMPFPLAPGEGKYGTRKVDGRALHNYIRGVSVRNTSIAFEQQAWYVSSINTVILEADGNLIRADGKPYKNKYIMVFTIRDQKIANWREYFNPVVAARTFGIPLESLPYN